MNTHIPTPNWLGFLSLTFLAVVSAGCEPESSAQPGNAVRANTQDKDKPKPPPLKTVPIGKNVKLEIQGQRRRVVVEASVCLQKGALELLLTRAEAKEHEAILAADLDARDLHKALLLTGARAGSPVQFQPKYKSAHGQVIKISLVYRDDKGKMVSVPAQQWIRDFKTRKQLTSDWVYAGSALVENPFDKKAPIFLANDGDLVCVSNFETALLDLPLESSRDAEDLAFEAYSERIPKVGTRVTIYLEPVPEKKK